MITKNHDQSCFCKAKRIPYCTERGFEWHSRLPQHPGHGNCAILEAKGLNVGQNATPPLLTVSITTFTNYIWQVRNFKPWQRLSRRGVVESFPIVGPPKMKSARFHAVIPHNDPIVRLSAH